MDFGTGADLAISPLSKFASLLWAFLISVSDVTAIACAIALIGFEIRGGSVISTQAEILMIFYGSQRSRGLSYKVWLGQLHNFTSGQN